jgi:hypothetical protein
VCGIAFCGLFFALTCSPRPLIARLPPFKPYTNSVDVTFTSVASLAPGSMADTGLLDFGIR